MNLPPDFLKTSKDMCYINGVKVSREEFIAYRQQQKELKQLMAAKLFFQPAKRSFDYTEWPIIRVDANGYDWDAVPMEWGIIPTWITTRAEAKQFRAGFPTYNARGIELLEKKCFATAARKGRCLVPSSWFFESMHVPKIGKQGQPLKTCDSIPFKISVADQPLFYMAGIYLPWFDHEKKEWIKTFSICTTDAGPVMAQIHNGRGRQPTILTPELAERWTEKNLTDKEITDIATHQFDNSKLSFHPVKRKFWEAEDPTEEACYENLPGIILN